MKTRDEDTGRVLGIAAPQGSACIHPHFIRVPATPAERGACPPYTARPHAVLPGASVRAVLHGARSGTPIRISVLLASAVFSPLEYWPILAGFIAAVAVLLAFDLLD